MNAAIYLTLGRYQVFCYFLLVYYSQINHKKTALSFLGITIPIGQMGNGISQILISITFIYSFIHQIFVMCLSNFLCHNIIVSGDTTILLKQAWSLPSYTLLLVLETDFKQMMKQIL